MESRIKNERTIEFIVKHFDEAKREFAKYNGFASQVMETAREENLSCQELRVMSAYTLAMCEFWSKMLDDAIEGRI